MAERKVYRSSKNRVIGGICGGIAEHLNIDPILLRIPFILFTIITGFIPGLLIYFIYFIAIPKDSK